LRHCGESTDPAEVFELARSGTPDVVLIDAGLTSADPLEIARQMRHLAHKLAIIILTPSRMRSALFQSIKFGASAYNLEISRPTI